jgi:hypothetical protein
VFALLSSKAHVKLKGSTLEELHTNIRSGPSHKYVTKLKMLARGKHSRLIVFSVSDERKKKVLKRWEVQTFEVNAKNIYFSCVVKIR